jgi:hypothetical protein
VQGKILASVKRIKWKYGIVITAILPSEALRKIMNDI